jgi:hypothetical protein
VFITFSITSIFLVPPNVYYAVFDSTAFVGISVILSFFYALIRPNYIEKYLKQNLEQAVIEFETVKKIIPLILLIVVGLFIIFRYISLDPSSFDLVAILSKDILLGIGVASILMYGLIILKKEFRFYFAKTCFVSALNQKDTFRQMYYYGLGLQEYNKYLKRHLKRQIKDIDKIFSKMSLLDNDGRTRLIHSLSDSFETGADKLKPIRSISTELMKSKDTESALVPESLKSHLKVIGTFLAASIPIVVSVITLYMTITMSHK